MKQALCPMTHEKADYLFSEKVLGKHQAHIFINKHIRYMFMAEPGWLAEAYEDAIAITDTGILVRNLRNQEFIEHFLPRLLPNFDRGVDLGGGLGILVRLLRDTGYNFYWSDRYATNSVSRGFEAEERKYDCALAFEVLEHLPNPLEFLRRAIYNYDPAVIIFSATCFDEDGIPGKDWWYWAFETGQHISFFSKKTLTWMAKQLGYEVIHLAEDVYAFSKVPLLPSIRRPLTVRLRSRIAKLVAPPAEAFPVAKSLTLEDFERMRTQLELCQAS